MIAAFSERWGSKRSLRAAQEIAQPASFEFIKKAIDYKELETLFA